MIFRKLAFIAAVALFSSAPAFALNFSFGDGPPVCQLKEPGSALPDCNQAFKQFEPKPAPAAQPQVQEVSEQRCTSEAYAYSQAVAFRNAGYFPAQAFGYIKGGLANSKLPMLPDAGIKKAINLVYFDNRMQGIGSAAMMSGVRNICMHPDLRFKPMQ